MKRYILVFNDNSDEDIISKYTANGSVVLIDQYDKIWIVVNVLILSNLLSEKY